MPHVHLDLFDPSVTHAPPRVPARRGRRNELLEVADLALIVCRRQLDDYSCPKSKRTYTQPQLLACLVLKAYLKQTYRGIVEVLGAGDALRAALGLSAVPAHTTLKEFAGRVLTPALLDQAVGEALALLVARGLVVTGVAVDSTGVETSGASAHFRTRAGRTRGGYVKLSLAVACAAVVLVTMALSMGPSNDLCEARDVLWRAASRCGADWYFMDKGYDAEWPHALCAAAGARSHIPPVPKTTDGSIRTGPHRVRCGRHRPYHYGNRWHAESFISGLKRTCGSTLAARGEAALLVEAGLKALAYAIRR